MEERELRGLDALGRGMYTVFGVYQDNWQPYTTSLRAKDEDDAATKAQRMCHDDNGWESEFDANDPPLVVVGVIHGEHRNLV